MRPAVIWLSLLAIAVAEIAEEPWVEEEVDEPYNDEVETHERRRRETYVEEPYEEHVRVKRRCYDEVVPEPHYRVRRSEEYVRVPRQVHQYEVHEFTDEAYPSSVPYEEMLAASAEHYHRVYAAPGAPAPARYLSPDVSQNVGQPFVPVGHPAQFVAQNVPVAAKPVQFLSPPNVPVGPPAQFVAQNVPVASKPVQYVSPQNVPVAAHPARFVENPTVASQPTKFVNPNVAPNPVNDHVQFVAPPVASVSAIAPEALIHGPVPVQSAPVAQTKKLAGDQYGSAANHHHGHKHSFAQGGGHSGHAGHHADRGGKSSKGFKTDHHVDKGAKGHKTDEVHRKQYEEAAGKKNKHHDHAGHKGSHEEEAHGHRGAHFGEKKGHKKGHKTKGYHNKYHKDEFHKEHKFYDDFHKSGDHHRYGKFNAKHASNESGKKKAHHVNAGHDFVERGKKGYSNKGHLDEDHTGYKGGQGHEEHHAHHSQHGKKGGKEGGSQWGYEKKN